jgi:hypothetical protein
MKKNKIIFSIITCLIMLLAGCESLGNAMSPLRQQTQQPQRTPVQQQQTPQMMPQTPPQTPSPAVCGDKKCEGSETSATCPADCKMEATCGTQKYNPTIARCCFDIVYDPTVSKCCSDPYRNITTGNWVEPDAHSVVDKNLECCGPEAFNNTLNFQKCCRDKDPFYLIERIDPTDPTNAERECCKGVGYNPNSRNDTQVQVCCTDKAPDALNVVGYACARYTNSGFYADPCNKGTCKS